MEFRSSAEFEAERVQVEALGEPGQRRFRLLAVVGGDTTIVWMEKQQLQALGMALEQMLSQLPEEEGPDLGGSAPVPFDLATRRQFRVGRMELGFDESSGRIVIVTHDANEDEDEEEEIETDTRAARFICGVSREQARELSSDAAAVVAAGRPRCTMCGAPMGPGPHACPQQNGHFPHHLPEGEVEDEGEA